MAMMRRDLVEFWRSSSRLGRMGLALAACGALLFALSLLGAEAEGAVLVPMIAVHLSMMGFLAIIYFRESRAAAGSNPFRRGSLRTVPRIVIVLVVLAGAYVIAFFTLAPLFPERVRKSSWTVLHGLSAGYVFVGLLGAVLIAAHRQSRGDPESSDALPRQD